MKIGRESELISTSDPGANRSERVGGDISGRSEGGGPSGTEVPEVYCGAYRWALDVPFPDLSFPHWRNILRGTG